MKRYRYETQIVVSSCGLYLVALFGEKAAVAGLIFIALGWAIQLLMNDKST